jgi:hypothetical protein
VGRHEGWRTNSAPAPDAGAHPAVGTAAISTPPVEPVPPDEPTPTAEAVLTIVDQVCDLYARAEIARAMAGLSENQTEYADQAARAAHWDTLGRERYQTLAAMVHAGLADVADIERFMPVRPLNNGYVELYAYDTDSRRVVVLFAGAQALAVGAHLTAYGAVSLDRIGQKLETGLPQVNAAPPLTDPSTTSL